MKHRKKLLLLLFLLQIIGVSARSFIPDSLQTALEKSGENRETLLALLKKYRGNKEKFAAACFLIHGMPYHEQGGRVLSYDARMDSLWQVADEGYFSVIQNKSVEQQESDSVLSMLRRRSDEAAKRNMQRIYAEPEVEGAEMPDLQYVSGQYLEWVIEHAFAMRQRFPRLQQLPLHVFFEYLLPYRAVNGYPLLADYRTLYERFGKYLKVGASVNVEQLAETYNRTLEWLRRWNGKYPYDVNIGLNDLYWNGFHDCVDMAHYCASILRACGIPACVEYNAAYRVKQGRHFMVNVLDDDGHWVPFSPEGGLPSTAHVQMQDALNIFRQHFSPQNNNPMALKMVDEAIPEDFEDCCLEDVSVLYYKVKKFVLPAGDIPAGHALAYLATFTPETGLTPVTWGTIDRKKNVVTFPNAVPNNIYFPVYCGASGTLTPLPLLLRWMKTAFVVLSN